MIHGILNVRKEKGFTSHDVVAKLRGMTRQKDRAHRNPRSGCGRRPSCLSWQGHQALRDDDGQGESL